MNADLKTFITALLRVVLPTLLVVATVAFTTLPYSLGHHPGEHASAPHPAPVHLT